MCGWPTLSVPRQSIIGSYQSILTENIHENQSATISFGDETTKGMILPKLIIFDLDNTLWTPELYQLRNKLPKATKNCDFVPQAGKDVMLFEGARRLLQQPSDDYLPTTRPGIALGIASRTKSVEWAHALLGQFQLTSILNHVEIFPGSKKQHFQNIQKASGGIEYKDMLFFDDARDGKYGNCEPIANLGCLTVHTPNGLQTVELFDSALEQYHIWRTQHEALPGCIVEVDGTLSLPSATSDDSTMSSSTEQRQVGVVKLMKDRYGFITYRNGPISRDLFFPFNAVVGAGERTTLLENRRLLEEGATVSFVKQRDPRNQGKWVATDVAVEKAPSSTDETDGTSSNMDFVEFKCFSMNQPFAALLANGFKTLETRNGTMFERYAPGTRVLLHVGQRVYPDGDRHLEILDRAGKNEAQISRLKQLPQGFGKGNIVAALELGKTFLTTLEERSRPDHEEKVVAYGSDSGQYATEIVKVAYLKRPIPMKGQAGLFKVHIPIDALPDGWRLVESQTTNSRNERASLVATISG